MGLLLGAEGLKGENDETKHGQGRRKERKKRLRFHVRCFGGVQDVGNSGGAGVPAQFWGAGVPAKCEVRKKGKIVRILTELGNFFVEKAPSPIHFIFGNDKIEVVRRFFVFFFTYWVMTLQKSLGWTFLFFFVLFPIFWSCSSSKTILEEHVQEPATVQETGKTGNVGVKQLKLDNTETTDADVKRICEENPDLVELTLGGTKVTDDSLVHLTQLKKLKKLRLSRTAVSDAGMNALAKCESLEDIDLSQTKIGDFGLWELRALPRLKRLNLYLTFVSDTGLDSFGERDNRSAKKIVWLNLDKCPITDKGIPKLASLTNLEWTHLGGTGITDVGLEELTKFKQLKDVSVTKTETTLQGVEKLRAALPNCTVRDNISEKTPEADIAEAVQYRKELREKMEKVHAAP